MNTCEKCPLVSGNCFQCEYCSKKPTPPKGTNDTVFMQNADEVNQLVTALINQRNSLSCVQDFKLKWLYKLLRIEVTKREKQKAAYRAKLREMRMKKTKEKETEETLTIITTESSTD